MRYLIRDASRRTLAVIDVPAKADMEPTSIAVERDDRPDLLYVGVDLYADGSIVVGHWPDGEHWDRVVHVRTEGVSDHCGRSA